MRQRHEADRDVVMSCAAVRECDRVAVEHFGVPSILLMENAGSGAARWVQGELARRGGERVCVLAGPGNNGGDGFVVARHLANEGVEVEVVLLAPAEKIKGDAAVNLGILRRMPAGLHELGGARPDKVGEAVREYGGWADVVVDAMLGTGTRGEPREPIRTAIEVVNDLGKPVVALDTPSGLDCDTGEAAGAAVRAVATVTFAAMKRGFGRDGAVAYTGPVQVVGIGVAAALLAGERGGPGRAELG